MSQIKSDFSHVSMSMIEEIPYILVGHHQDSKKDIHIKNLTVRTPGAKSRTLVENLDMVLTAGSRTVLTGASGSGKTLTAQAILGQYDYGTGLILMPDQLKVMSMSQNAYFPNTNLRGIMNAKPAGKELYEDDALTSALTEVGLDRLVQQIPGQRIKTIMDELVIHAENKLRTSPYGTDKSLQELKSELESLARKKVTEQFNTVQFTPDACRTYFIDKLTKVLQPLDFSTSKAEELAHGIIDTIDIQLAVPLVEFLKQAAIRESLQGWGSIPSRVHGSLKTLTDTFRGYAGIKKEEAEKGIFSRSINAIDTYIAQPAEAALACETKISRYDGWGHFLPHTEEKIKFLKWNMRRILAKNLKKYMHNEDTDDAAREIRLNSKQAAYIAERVPAELAAHLSAKKAQSLTSATLSRVTWPLSAKTLHGKAGRLAKNLTQALAAYMDHHILRGENITLSGGERQKLIIAMVALHKPDVLILDEITAALDRPTALKLYKDMLDNIPPQTTVLSIAHNEHIIPLHTHHAHLDNKTIALRKIQPEMPQSPGLTI